MTTTDRAGKRRARRIAADEAHAWARNLRLNNSNAKLVLLMLTQYVNGDGICWVSVPALAEDCELAQNTIRSRLEFLEDVGAIVRMPQWLDEYGRRNGDGRGKRTSDDIKLLVDADIDLEMGSEAAPVSPSPHEGLNSEAETVSTSVALQQPFNSVKGLISEPEPESPPKSPSGGEGEGASLGEESEPEHFGPAWVSWRGHEVMRRDLALADFRRLAPEKQLLCRAAIPLFFKRQDELERKHTPNFHLWIRAKGFEEFPFASLAAAPSSPSGDFDQHSREGRAIQVMYAVARTRPFENLGRVRYLGEVTPQVLAFADAEPSSAWLWIEDRQQIAAWSSFLASHIRNARPPLVTTKGLGDAQRAGCYAPWPWPPRKDGTISQSQAGDDAA